MPRRSRPGFLTVAREAGLPLRILEMGTSAGLNLRWDYFRYEAPGQAWGDARSPVVLRDAWESCVLPSRSRPPSSSAPAAIRAPSTRRPTRAG